MKQTLHRSLAAIAAALPLAVLAAAAPPAIAPSVDRVEVGGDIELEIEIEIADRPAVSVTPESCAAALVWTVGDGKLELRAGAPTAGCAQRPLMVELTLQRLAALTVHGAAEVSARGLKAPSLRVEMDGSGDVELNDIDTEQFELIASGSGDAMLRGRAQRQRFDLRGDGDVDASGLRGSSAELQTSGASDVQLNVADTLAVRSSGSGDIRYAGSPSVDRRGLDSGSLRRRD